MDVEPYLLVEILAGPIMNKRQKKKQIGIKVQTNVFTCLSERFS